MSVSFSARVTVVGEVISCRPLIVLGVRSGCTALGLSAAATPPGQGEVRLRIDLRYAILWVLFVVSPENLLLGI